MVYMNIYIEWKYGERYEFSGNSSGIPAEEFVKSDNGVFAE